MNTGGLLERLNFGLALASNRIPGTRVDLKRFAGDVASGQSIDRAKMMDRFLNVIVGGEISPRTRDTLLKQLEREIDIPSQPAKLETAKVGNGMDGSGGPPQRRRELARADASITDPVTRIVGLILGSPEFQRQ